MAVETRIFPRMDVAVLCGGPGAERAISLESGEAACIGLADAGWTARKVVLNGTPGELDDLSCGVAFLALHGEYGEDGTVQRLLDERSITYTGSPAAASALAMDKDAAKQALVHAGLPTPWWTVVEESLQAAETVASMGFEFPAVVKPVSGGSSVGASIVHTMEELEPAVAAALTLDSRVMIEEYVPGRELTAGMLAGVALPLVELTPRGEFFDYESKYHDDEMQTLCPAPFSAEETCDIQTLAMRTLEVLGVEHFGRVDLMLGPEGPMVLEVNTIPGFTSHSLLPLAARASGITFPLLVTRIVKLALDRAGLLEKINKSADK